MITLCWKHKESKITSDILQVFFYACLEPKLDIYLFRRSNLWVREYRNDPSEDTTTHQTAAVTIAWPDGLPKRQRAELQVWLQNELIVHNLHTMVSDYISVWGLSPGPVSQVDENWWTLGCLLTKRRDSPIHQNGLSPNSNLENTTRYLHKILCFFFFFM